MVTMVYRGKPSQGCDNCRKLHVKCDEKVPECSRCLKMKRKCSGYRDQSDLIFHNESAVTRKRARCSSTSSRENSRSLVAKTYHDSELFYSFGVSLSASDNARYLHTQLPGLYCHGDLGSAIRLATQAISYAFLTKIGRNTAQVSRSRYLQAIIAIQKAIQDPLKSKSDQTLYAILLVCGYETVMCDSETIPGWEMHVDGAAALMKIRGYESLGSPIFRGLFLFLRKSLVISHLQTSRPIDPIFTELDMTTYLSDNVEDQLISKATKIPELQQRAKGLLVHSYCKKLDNSVLQLISAATSLDRELSDWTHNVPNSWKYSTATSLHPPLPHLDFIPRYLHRYAGIYTARVWNTFRVARLVVQSILLRVVFWLDGMSASNFPELDIYSIESIIGELADDICASVPFLLGHDLLKMKSHAANDTGEGTYCRPSPNMGSKHNTIVPSGQFSLIWPLYIGSSAPSIPEKQRRWMRAQLKLIADGGESQAQILLDGESQTLSGGTETFRFDCV